jgi:uncharacterized repeat protein (TIGR02543 family)
MKKLPFVMLTLLVLAACNNNSSITPSSSSIRPSTSITTSSSSTSSSSETNDERYAIYVKAQAAGFTGTYQEWLDSIKGADGTSLMSGTSNPTSSQGKNGDTFINTSTWDVYVKSGGNWTKVGNVMGPKGDKGDQGVPGQAGEDGLSSYEIYIANYPDYQGDEEQWLQDLINGNLAEVQTFTVTFESNGGTSVPSQEVKRLDKVTKPEEPTKTGYSFDGWYVGDEEWVFSGYNVTEDITLTAQWIEIPIESFGQEGILYTPYVRNQKLEYAVTGYLGNQTSITIPSKANGYDVTAIGPHAFNDQLTYSSTSASGISTSLRNVNLPDSLVTIGAFAFAYSMIESIVIPNNVTIIHHGAFVNSALQSLVIGNAVTTIGDWAFYGIKVSTIIIPENVVSIGSQAFSSLVSLTINVVAATQPEGWNQDWYIQYGWGGTITIIWDYKNQN